jgi:hypothetical protein
MTTTTTPTGHLIRCSPCGSDGGPFPTRPEAESLARVHDSLWHGGAPTATTHHAQEVTR